MTFRLSEVPTALSTQEKSTPSPQRPGYRIPGIDCQVGMNGRVGREQPNKNLGLAVLPRTRLSSLDGKESLDEGHGFSRAIKVSADEGFSP